MNARVTLCLIVFACIVAAIAIAATLPGPLVKSMPVIRYEIVHTFPHDRFAFTEGLAYSQGSLIEGAGIKGNSTLRRVNITTGEVIRERRLAEEYFGEGVAVFGDRIVELTQDSHTGFIYNVSTFAQVGTFIYPTEGWGVTGDGTSLIMSDGTAVLHFLDPSTFREVREVRVMDHGIPVESLNELEYVKGEIYANVWPTDRIARISPVTGEVLGWIDLTGLLTPGEQALIGWPAIESLRGNTTIPFDKQACLNGIAYDPEGDRLFVTGKLWPSLFEVRVNGTLLSHPVETVTTPAETAPQPVTTKQR